MTELCHILLEIITGELCRRWKLTKMVVSHCTQMYESNHDDERLAKSVVLLLALQRERNCVHMLFTLTRISRKYLSKAKLWLTRYTPKFETCKIMPFWISLICKSHLFDSTFMYCMYTNGVCTDKSSCYYNKDFLNLWLREFHTTRECQDNFLV